MLDKAELKSRIRSDTYSQIKGLDDIWKSVILILVWFNFFKCMQTKRQDHSAKRFNTLIQQNPANIPVFEKGVKMAICISIDSLSMVFS